MLIDKVCPAKNCKCDKQDCSKCNVLLAEQFSEHDKKVIDDFVNKVKEYYGYQAELIFNEEFLDGVIEQLKDTYYSYK